MDPCPECQGTGVVDCYDCDGSGFGREGHEEDPCPTCNGDGDSTCDTCEGSGEVPQEAFVNHLF